MTKLLKSASLLAVVSGSLLAGVGCSREVAHTESDKPGFFGGNTHTETTTYKNPDGTTSTEKNVQKTD